MSTELDEQTLEEVANNGEMDYEKWPSIIEPLLQRLNQIVYTDFPMPRPYPSINRPHPPSSPLQTQPIPLRETQISQTPSTPIRSLPPVPPFPNSSATSTSHIPDSLPPSQDLPPQSAPQQLPVLLLQILNSVVHTLRSSFSDRPPHTIQRLAELTLYPTRHYKTLPAWLRALDRVVSVSSAADIFPLSDTPPLVNGVNGDGAGGILWNNDTRNGYDSASLGSDESLGGALLTPIPWLRNGMHSGAEDSSEESGLMDSNTSASSDSQDEALTLQMAQSEADPMVPERPDGAVTQGELIRLEQEAGVVPVTRNPSDNHVSGTMDDAQSIMDESEGMPHARGPDLVGSVDMGRVDGQDVELRIGSPPGGPGQERATDANDAQSVLEGGASSNTAAATTSEAGSALDSEDFEIVLKDVAEADDAMQLDGSSQASLASQQPSEEQDGDIVLVDADGKTNDEGEDAQPAGV